MRKLKVAIILFWYSLLERLHNQRWYCPCCDTEFKTTDSFHEHLGVWMKLMEDRDEPEPAPLTFVEGFS